jgi:hypothetical protein
VHDFKQLIYDAGFFYMIANKRDNKLGFYLLKIRDDEPLGKMNSQIDNHAKEKMFLINWQNKLDIGDVDM